MLAAIAYAGAIVAFGRGPLSMNSNIFGFIVNTIGALVPIGLYLALHNHRQVSTNTQNGIMWALFGGICIGIFTIALAFIFSKGSNVSFVTPLVYGGAVLTASIASILIFKEKAMPYQIIGLLFIVIGILLISAAQFKLGDKS